MPLPDDLAQYAVKAPSAPAGQLPPDLAQYAVKSQTPQGASSGFWDRVKDVLKPKKYSEEAGFAAKQKGQTEALPGVSEGAGLAGGLAEWDKASGGEIAGGVGDILQGEVSKGLHRIFTGTGHAMTPMLPLMGPGMIAAPVTTGVTIGGGLVGGALAKGGAEALGASPAQAQVAGDVGQLVGGIGANRTVSLTRDAISKARTLWDLIPEETQKSLQKKAISLVPGASKVTTALDIKKDIGSVLDALRSAGESAAPAAAKTAAPAPSGMTSEGWYYLGRLQEIAKQIDAEEAVAAKPKNITPSRAAALKNPVTPAASSDDLTSLLQESLKRAQAAKGKPLGGSLADLQ